jgi:hypothetical protein
MERRIINPMPESLDDVKIKPGDFIAPNQAVNVNVPSSAPSQDSDIPDAKPSIQRQSEIDESIRARLTNEALDKEILDEKIRQDINSVKKFGGGTEALGPRDFLKFLIAKGDYREDVMIYGKRWTIRALNQGDIITSFNDIKDDTATTVGKVSVLVLSQIAYAIEAMDGVSVYEWFSEIVQRDKFSTTEDFKLAVRRVLRRYLEQMPNSIISEFDTAYAEVERKRNEAIVELKKL